MSVGMLIALPIASYMAVKAKAAQSSSGIAHLRNSEILDIKAVNAQAGDEDSIRSLATGVFESFGWANRTQIRGQALDRIVKAEMSYRSGQQPAIHEEDLVRSINSLSDALSLPDYARTDMEQVRYLRTSLMVSSPHLVGVISRAQSETKIPSIMSPIEATYVAMSLVHQKLFNPAFQESPVGWLARRQTESIQKWSQTTGASSRRPKLISTVNPKSANLLRTLTAALAARSTDVTVDHVLDNLGVLR
jgi:hypothetical protein